MTKICRGCFLVVLPGIVLGWAGSGGFAQGTDDRVRRVLADWQARQGAVKGVRYAVAGESIVPRGSCVDPLTGRPLVPPSPPQDIVEPQDFILTLDFVQKRCRLELSQQLYHAATGEMIPRKTTTVYDGTVLGTEIPRSDNSSPAAPRPASDPDVTLTRRVGSGKALDMATIHGLAPLLLAHGLIPRLLVRPGFDDKPNAEDFHVHGQAGYAGRVCLVLRTHPLRSGSDSVVDEFWIDPERSSAVVRHLSYIKTRVANDWEIEGQALSFGWVPARWSLTVRNGAGHVTKVIRLRVTEATPDPPMGDADFYPVILPGMNVLEATGEQGMSPGTWYRVAENGKWIEIGNEAGKPRFPLGLTAAAVVLLGCAVLGVWYLWRYGRWGQAGRRAA
jgi:hypothetical protein